MKLEPRREFLRGLAAVVAGTALVRRAAAAPPPRIKIGQIGVGHAHASKLAVYRASADYEVVGVVEPDEGLRRRAAEQPAFKDLPWMTREQLLNVPGLQAALVETRVRDLLDHAEVCVHAGLHTHIDKPAGESLPQLRRILERADQARRIVQMGYMFRYNPAVVMLREFLKAGWLGAPFEVHAVMSKVVDPASRRQLAEYRGGIMFELGCHVLDLVIGILGPPAEMTGIAQHAAPADDGLRDNMLAVGTWPRAIATVKSSAQEVEGGARRQLTVCGTEGTFHIQPLDAPTIRVALSQPRGPWKSGWQDVPCPKYTRYVDDAADMVRVIRGEKAFEFTSAHDLAVQTALLQACGLPVE